MDCLNPTCQNEVISDYPLCKDCAPARHFQYRNDCQCEDCQGEREATKRLTEFLVNLAERMAA